MKTRNKYVKLYLKNVYGGLIGVKSMKSVMLSDLKSSAYDYVMEHPDCTLDDLYRDIGTPEEIALPYDTPECIEQIKKEAKKYHKLKWVTVVLCFITIIAIFVTVIIILNNESYRVDVVILARITAIERILL